LHVREMKQKIDFLLGLGPSTRSDGTPQVLESTFPSLSSLQLIRAKSLLDPSGGGEITSPTSPGESSDDGATSPTGPGLGRHRSHWVQAKNYTKMISTTMHALVNLKKMVKDRTSVANSSPEGKLLASLSKFTLFQMNSIPSIKASLIAQRRRAVSRLLGLRYFIEVMRPLRSSALVPELLRHLSLSLREPSIEEKKTTPTTTEEKKEENVAEPLVKIHFLDQLEAAGLRFSELLSGCYYSLLGHVMAKEQLSHASTVMLLDLCNVNATPSDLVYLKQVGVVPFLARALTEPLVAFVGDDSKLQEIVKSNQHFQTFKKK